MQNGETRYETRDIRNHTLLPGGNNLVTQCNMSQNYNSYRVYVKIVNENVKKENI